MDWIRRHREEALDNPVIREILELLGDDGLSSREVRARLRGDYSLGQVRYHLGRLRDADLVRQADGRYWRMVSG